MPLNPTDQRRLDDMLKKDQAPASQAADPEPEEGGIKQFGRGVGRGLTQTGLGGVELLERMNPAYPIYHWLSGGSSLTDLMTQAGPGKTARDFARLPDDASATEIAGKVTGEVAPMFIPGLGGEAAAAKVPRLAEDVIPGLFKRAESKAGEWTVGKSEYGPMTGERPKSGFEPATKERMSAQDYQRMLREEELAKAAGKKAPRTDWDRLMDVLVHEGPFAVAHHFHMPIWMAFGASRLLNLARRVGFDRASKWVGQQVTPGRIGAAGTATEGATMPDSDQQ